MVVCKHPLCDVYFKPRTKKHVCCSRKCYNDYYHDTPTGRANLNKAKRKYRPTEKAKAGHRVTVDKRRGLETHPTTIKPPDKNTVPCIACGYLETGFMATDHIVPCNPRPGEPRGCGRMRNKWVLCQACNNHKSNRPWPELVNSAWLRDRKSKLRTSGRLASRVDHF